MARCEKCDREFDRENLYRVGGQDMCEKCGFKHGLHPLGHTGLRRDKISEKGRCLTPRNLSEPGLHRTPCWYFKD